MFVAGFAQLDSVDEIDVILDFNRLYSDTSISFNWDIFDVDNKSRQRLVDFFSIMFDRDRYTSFQYYSRNCKCIISDELKGMFLDLAKAKKFFILDSEKL